MNLLLLLPEDMTSSSRALLTGRRVRHIASVLQTGAGDILSVGMVNGKIGMGTVTSREGGVLEMDVLLDREPPAKLPLTIVLALPRPKVLRRVLRSLTVMGTKRIVLVNSARVEKSYWQTPFLEADAIREQLILGLEQAKDTVLPEVALRPLFKPFVEDELPVLSQGSLRLVAHPGAESDCPRDVRQPVTLAIGPEGGFIPYEIERLRVCGFTPVGLGPRILSVETAVPALISRLF